MNNVALGHAAELAPVETVRVKFQRYHNADAPLDDVAMDNLLGLRIQDSERQAMNTLAQHMPTEYRGENLWLGADYVWSHYEDIRSTVKALSLSPDDVVYDLGSGYGRLPLYVGLTTPAKAKGIEILAERSEAAQAAKQGLGLESVDFITGNVLDQDISDGTVFYMFNPFSDHTFRQVADELKELAATKRITIVSSNDHVFYDQGWLTEVARPNWLTVVYESNDLAKEQPSAAAATPDDPTREAHANHRTTARILRLLGSSLKAAIQK